MQTTRLPASTTHALQKLVRAFIWGTTSISRGIPLVKWDTMCLPKDCGGYGLKNFEAQNTAFLMKVAFKMRTEPHLLWVKVLASKYKWTNRPPTEYKRNAHHSHTWRSISMLWQDLELGLKWHTGEGTTIRFWTDHWLGDRGPLHLLADKSLSEVEAALPISHYLTDLGTWRTAAFASSLPADVVDEIQRTQPYPLAPDQPLCTWVKESKGFSVRSAYQVIKEDEWDNLSPKWWLAWNWCGPQRIRTFLWLVLSNKLLTNKERCRRHMTETKHCDSCSNKVEDMEHVLRGCALAKECWGFIVPRDRLESFSNLPFDKWLAANLKDGQRKAGWSTMFGILCWKFWQARNRRIFSNEDSQPHTIILEAVGLQCSVQQAANKTSTLRL